MREICWWLTVLQSFGLFFYTVQARLMVTDILTIDTSRLQFNPQDKGN